MAMKFSILALLLAAAAEETPMDGGVLAAGSELPWVAIPAGTFKMGCVPGDGLCDAQEKPRHSERVRAFSLMKIDVTVAAYFRCVDAVVCTAPASGQACNGRDRPDHPVNCVTWDQAVAFCRWIGGRLPTAAEWEYAARGGEDRIFPWGNAPPTPERVRYDARAPDARTDPVGAHPQGASKWGLLDMAGNVSQWTSTLYDPSKNTVAWSEDPPSGYENRGGCFRYNYASIRNTRRDWEPPQLWSDMIGFRCAK